MSQTRDAKGRFAKAASGPRRSSGRRYSRERIVDIVRRTGTYGALGYQSATVASREGRSAIGASGEAHARYDRIKLINQSREFMRNNGIYRGMIERAVSYIVSNGFGLQAKTNDEEFNKAVEKLWNDNIEGFWKRPEIKGILSGRRVERMVCREILITGDHGVILTNKGKLQLIESEQITGGSKLPDGIEKDAFGAPKKFWVASYNRWGRVSGVKPRPYDPKDFLFITDPDRPSAVRGVPPCQASFPMLHRINDVCDSEAIAWQLLARMAVSINRKEGPTLGYAESREDPNKSAEDAEGDLATRLTELDYALIFHGEEGEEVKGIERNIPGKNFSDSLIMFLRLLGLPLGVPLEVILLDWTKSNYSQSRAVLEQAYQTFLGWQFLLEDFFYVPVYEWKVRSWIKEGKLRDVDDRFAHEWIKPTFPWIDQLKEAQAYGAKVDRGFATHAQVCKSLNAERQDIVDARESEVRDAIQRAKKIQKETGVAVPWQIFAGLRPPGETAGRPGGAAATSKMTKDEDTESEGDEEE